MSKPSYQKIFNRVATHLLTQKKKAAKRTKNLWGFYEESCLYRTEDGKACAVGCLLNDKEAELADSSNAGAPASVRHLKKVGLLPKRFLGKEHFLTDLQSIHDTVKPSRWIQKLNVFAKNHKLNADVLKQFR